MPPSDQSSAPDTGGLPDEQAVVVDTEDEDRALLQQLTVGAIVDGKYQVESVLGRGAMGVVVSAVHQQLGEKVALKFLHYRAKAGAGADDFQSRFRREARVSAKLKNEHITRVIDVGLWQGRVPYMVMDYLDGGDLRQLIKGEGPLPIGVAIDYAVQVCVGIAEAHANGVVHRDLKPSNLFLTKRADGSDLVKILDFGISKWRAGESEIDELTQTGVVLGSPKYMAPEQLFGSSDVDARADVWSIGAIVYEMIAGRPPFDLPTFTRICAELSTDHPPPSLIERRPEVTPELEAVVMKCFQRDPDKRTRDVAELAGDLLDAVQAPFAAAMRQKVASMLDPAAGLSTSSGGMSSFTRTGSFAPLGSGAYTKLSTTGSGPRGSSTTSSNPMLTGAAAIMAPPVVEKRNGAILPGLLIGGIAVVGLAAYVMLANKPAAPAPSALVTPPLAASAPAPVPAPPPSAQAPAPSVAAAPSAAPSASPTAVATAAETAAAPQRPTWHSGWHSGASRPAPAPPPVTVAQAPTAAPQPAPVAPAPAPAPAPTKSDPLGDRQ